LVQPVPVWLVRAARHPRAPFSFPTRRSSDLGFGDRLRFTVQVAPEVLGVRVPFLCLQPLVENAIKHGMPGEVRVVIKDAGSEAHIWVEDDGIGMDPDQVKAVLSEEPTTGIGLSNVDR